MRRLMAMILAMMVTLLGFGMIVSALTETSDVVKALRKTAIPTQYLTSLESYLTTRTITSQQAKDLITHIKKADQIAGQTTAVSKLTTAQKTGILSEIVACGKILGLTVSYGNQTLRAMDQTQKIIFEISSANLIKQTGHDYGQSLIGLGLMISAIGMAFLLWRRQTVGCAA